MLWRRRPHGPRGTPGRSLIDPSAGPCQKPRPVEKEAWDRGRPAAQGPAARERHTGGTHRGPQQQCPRAAVWAFQQSGRSPGGVPGREGQKKGVAASGPHPLHRGAGRPLSAHAGASEGLSPFHRGPELPRVKKGPFGQVLPWLGMSGQCTCPPQTGPRGVRGAREPRRPAPASRSPPSPRGGGCSAGV